jgi:hypothetical protein
MARFIISHLTPVQFVQQDPPPQPWYDTKHMDNYWHAERLNKWQSVQRHYIQPWTQYDNIKIQCQSNAGIPQLRAINCNNQVMLNITMTQKQQNVYEPDYFIYEGTIDCGLLDEGIYYLEIAVGAILLISEPIDVRDEHPGTLLIEYSHYKFYQNIIFETGYAPMIRVHGLLQYKPPGSKDTLYEDQVLDIVMIQSKPFRLWDMIVGAGEPIPDWMIDKLNRVVGCSTLQIEDVLYTKNEGAKWELNDVVGYGALSTYTIELREAINADSKIFDPNVADNVNIILNVSSKGFADTVDNEGTILTVTNVD